METDTRSRGWDLAQFLSTIHYMEGNQVERLIKSNHCWPFKMLTDLRLLMFYWKPKEGAIQYNDCLKCNSLMLLPQDSPF